MKFWFCAIGKTPTDFCRVKISHNWALFLQSALSQPSPFIDSSIDPKSSGKQ